MTSFIQIATVVLLIAMCFWILSPFLTMIVWAAVIAIAIYPLHVRITARLGNRAKLSASLLTLLGLAILLVPTIYLAESTVVATQKVADGMRSGAIKLPMPDASVADWPLIGDQVLAVWTGITSNLEQTLNGFAPQLRAIGEWLVGFAGHFVLGIFQFIVSIVLSGALLVSAEGGYRVTRAIATGIAPARGLELIDMSIATIRSVAKGVLGVAVIQALLSAVGLLMIGVPAAGLWAFLILVLAIVQLPPLIVLGPIVVWVFSVADGTPAIIFAVYALVVSLSDSFLKPMFLGRGMDLPMLVILLGAIGGAMARGIIGLFTGAVVLAVGYTLFRAWTDRAPENRGIESPPEPA